MLTKSQISRIPSSTKKILNVIKDEKGRVISFDIDRRFWVRGKDNEGSSLLNRIGKMCCLGHYARACNVSKVDIYQEAYPSGVRRKNKLPEQMLWLFEDDNLSDNRDQFQMTLANINDDETLKQSDRERRIKRKFARKGITVNFVN